MKIMTIAKFKDSATLLPPAAMAQIAQVSIAEVKQQKKAGKILDWYYCPGSFQSVIILNYDSAEEWARDQAKIPLLMYCDSEVYPLADYEDYLNNMMAAMGAAAKNAPK